MLDSKGTKEEDFTPTREEVEMVVQKLKQHKAPGTENIPAEIFNFEGDELLTHLHSILREIFLKKKCQQIGI